MKIPLEHFNATPVFALSPSNDPSRANVEQNPATSSPCWSAGSAPGSPKSQPKEANLPTISASLAPPMSLPYATLPKGRARRLSLIHPSPSQLARQKLEGQCLTVCFNCKEMVLQVIRTSTTARRLRAVKALENDEGKNM